MANFRDFAIDALLIPDGIFQETKIQEIIRVRNSPSGRVHMEARVTFDQTNDRDYFSSKARNLAEYRDQDGHPQAGVRLDVPPFLMSTFKQLNDHGYDIRSVHGRETKRYIKFDDERLSLVLEVMLPNTSKWIRVSPEQARTYFEEKDQIDYGTLRRDLLRVQRAGGPSREGVDNPNLIPIGRRQRDSTNSRSSISSNEGSGSTNPSLSSNSAPRKKWIPPTRGRSTEDPDNITE